MHPIWIVLIVVGGLLLAYGVFCIFVAKKVLRICTQPIAHTFEHAMSKQSAEANVDFGDYLNNWNKEQFVVDGVHGKISGEVVFHPDWQNQQRKKVAIFCHGHSWNRINSLKYAEIFYQQGYSLVLYDHAYFGLSDGNFTTLGYYEKHDLSAVIDHAKSVFGKDSFVALHGESMGAATVLCLLGLRSDVDCVVADCGFSHTEKYYRELCRSRVKLPAFPIVDIANLMSKRKFGYDFGKTIPLECAKKSSVPICFIHGTGDKLIHYHHCQDMFNATSNRQNEIYLFENAPHAKSILQDKTRYRKVVCDFLQKIETLRNYTYSTIG